MALTFGAAANDNVDHGSSAELDDLEIWTHLFWVYPTTLTGFRTYSAKALNHVVFIPGNDTSQLAVSIAYGGAAAFYRTDNAAITVNKWWCLAVVYDEGGAANEEIQIYRGDLATGLTEATYDIDQDHAGAFTADAADPLVIGNINSLDAPLQGRIAVHLMWDRVLSLGELLQQQFRPHKTSGCVEYSHYGYNGTGSQADWSGSGNAGTVTGATVADHVPLGPSFGFDIPLLYAVGAPPAGIVLPIIPLHGVHSVIGGGQIVR